MDANILIVDDEPEIAELVEVYLKSEGFSVVKCETGTQALDALDGGNIDLAILDVMLPDISGFTLCGEIRKRYNFPVLMLTAKVEDVDKITGLTIGADDYITKPFNPLELVARVKAQLRRYTRYNEGEKGAGDVIDFNGLVINRATHECWLYDRELGLTPLEFVFSGCSAKTVGRSSPPSACLKAYGAKSIWTGTTQSWSTYADSGKRWGSRPKSPLYQDGLGRGV